MAVFVSCNDATLFQINKKVDLIISFIQQYRWIIEAYVSDFYTSDHWNKLPLPECVKEYIDATDPPDWAWMLEGGKKQNTSSKPAPLILQALNTYSRYLSIGRTAVDLDSSETNNNISCSLATDDYKRSSLLYSSQSKHNVNVSAFQPPNYKNGQCMDMQHIFRKHVKPKKQHEIQKLGQVINLLSEITKCKSVIDVGAGLGHLSRFLTFRFGLKATTIEAEGGHAPKASDLDRELKKDVIKKRNKVCKMDPTNFESGTESDGHVSMLYQNEMETDLCKKDENISKSNSEMTPEEELPSHVVCRISHDIASSQLMDVVRQNRSHCVSDSTKDNFILTGLHACGDLSPSLLRIFLNCQSAVGLASVACCYMKMEQLSTDFCDSSNKVLDNYPMSKLLKNIPKHDLTYESREMACHFVDDYCQRLKDNPPRLKIHSYRAALQYILEKVQPTFHSGQIRLVTKKGSESSFNEYTSQTLRKLKIDLSEIPQELLQHGEDLTTHWKRVVAFFTIRTSLAPVVETLILLDRILFLKENGINSVLVPIFDSKMSPRNFAVLSVKS